MRKNWYELQKETQIQVPLTFQKFSFFFSLPFDEWRILGETLTPFEA